MRGQPIANGSTCPSWCRCRRCSCAHPSDRATDAASIAAIAGALAGLGLAFILDRLIGGPGILCIFGF